MRSRKGASSWRLLLATVFAAMLVIKVACLSEASVGNRQSADPDELYQSIFQNEHPSSCEELSQTLPDNSLPKPDILPPSNLNLLKDGDLTNLNNQNNLNNAGNAYAPNQYHDIPSTFQTDTFGKPVYPSVGQQDNQQGFPSQTQPTYPPQYQPQYPAHDQSSSQQPSNSPYYPYVQDSSQQVPKYPYPGQHPANGVQASDQFNQPSLNNANMSYPQAYPSQSYPYGSQQYPNQQYPNQQYPNANQQYPNQQYPNQQYPNANQQQPIANQFPSNTVPTGGDKQPHDSAYQPESLDELLNEIRKRNNPYLKEWANEDVKRFGNRKDVLIQHLKNLLNADDINKYYSMPPYQSAPRSALDDMDYSNVPQKNLNEQNRTVPPNSPSMTPKFPDEFMKKDEDSESKQAQLRKIAAEKRSLPPTDQSRQLYNNEPRSMPFANNAARSFSLDQQLQQKQQRAETPKFDQMIPRSRLNESDCPNGLTMFRHPSRDGLTFLTAPEAEGYGYEYFFSKPKNGGPSYVTEAYVGPFFQKQRNGSGILFRWNYKTNQMENFRVENDRGREVGIRPRPSLGFAASPDPCKFLYGLMNHEIVKRNPSTFSPPFPLVGGLLGRPMMTGY